MNLFNFILISVDDEKDEHFCQFYDEDECRYKFVYNETVEKNGTVTLHVSRTFLEWHKLDNREEIRP
jgi:hypothetical protein